MARQAFVLLALALAAAWPRAAHAIACSPYVYPCHCGLCPRIVDCGSKQSAECFCGTAAPGIYPHPSDPGRFWMCSFDTHAQLAYGVEVACPGRLSYDPVVKACTMPGAVTQVAPAKPAPAASAAAATSAAAGPVAAAAPVPALGGASSASGPTKSGRAAAGAPGSWSAKASISRGEAPLAAVSASLDRGGGFPASDYSSSSSHRAPVFRASARP